MRKSHCSKQYCKHAQKIDLWKVFCFFLHFSHLVLWQHILVLITSVQTDTVYSLAAQHSSTFSKKNLNTFILTSPTGHYSLNIYYLKTGKSHAFLTQVCSMWMNLCQINFKVGSLDFDLILGCWHPLIRLKAIALRWANTKPSPMLPVIIHWQPLWRSETI